MKLRHVLIVDDDTGIRKLLSKFLSNNGYIVFAAKDIEETKEILQSFRFDVVVMDVMLPDESGIDFLKNNTVNTPVIMLSALGTVDDRINGLESGAHDYLAKPFEPRELLLRIKNIIKTYSITQNQSSYKFGDFEFNLQTLQLKDKEQAIHLTSNEKKLLAMLINNIGKIISRDEMVKSFSDNNIRTIDVQIARLRTKIEPNPKIPYFIQTIRGEGYVFWGDATSR